MKLRPTYALGTLLAALSFIVLSACDSASSVIAPQASHPSAWAPPTPYPPVQYPTEEPTPGLPPGLLTSNSPINSSSSPVEYAPVKGKIQQQLLQVEKDAAAVRGLDPLSDVNEHFITQDQLRDNMLSLQKKYVSREDARQSELQLWLLRLIKQPSIGLYQLQADVLSSEIAGYYDPSQKELFVLANSGDLSPEAKATLAHEYVHSLQDQHYDLSKVLPSTLNDTDKVLGAKSLVEGDATLSEVLYADQFLSAKDFNNLVEDSLSYGAQSSQVPDIFEEELHFPYTYGQAFVKALYNRGGYATVNKAFSDPPVSSEQIMHPEKYLAAQRDDPLPVGVPPLTSTLGAGWTYRFTESIGEFELGVMLKDNGIKSPDEAAAGWGGGQADLYEHDSNSLLVLGTRWDTQRDAVEFEAALRQSLALVGRFGPDRSDGVRYFNVKRVRDKVYYVASTDQTALKAALDVVK